MAVAHHAVGLRIPVFVIMPAYTSPPRLRVYRDYGAMVISYGSTAQDSQNHAHHLAKENGYLCLEEWVARCLFSSICSIAALHAESQSLEIIMLSAASLKKIKWLLSLIYIKKALACFHWAIWLWVFFFLVFMQALIHPCTHLFPFPPCRDDSVVYLAGLGTVGIELSEQVPKLDAVIVPAGGQSGVLVGTAAAIKHLNPRISVIVCLNKVLTTI